MSNLQIYEPKLSEESCEKFHYAVDKLLNSHINLFPEGWSADLIFSCAGRDFHLELASGGFQELAKIKLNLVKNDPLRLITGDDSLAYIQELAKNGPSWPLKDGIINANSLADLTHAEYRWLLWQFKYTNTFGGIKLRLNGQNETLHIGFHGSGMFDLYFALKIAKLFALNFSIGSAGFQEALDIASRKNPKLAFWAHHIS